MSSDPRCAILTGNGSSSVAVVDNSVRLADVHGGAVGGAAGRANHLQPSYLRRYLAGPSSWMTGVRLERLVALSGRTPESLTRALADFHTEKHRPQRTPPTPLRQNRPLPRTTIDGEPELSVHAVCTRFSVGARTVAPEPHPGNHRTRSRCSYSRRHRRPPPHVFAAHLGSHPRHHQYRNLLRQRHPDRQTTSNHVMSRTWFGHEPALRRLPITVGPTSNETRRALPTTAGPPPIISSTAASNSSPRTNRAGNACPG